MKNVIVKINELNKKEITQSKKIKEFLTVLIRLDKLDPKTKALWVEIYENANSDRERASILFTESFKLMGQSSADHITMGPILVKYIEKMTKCNDQILQLALLVQKAQEETDKMNPENIFSQIEGD